MNKDIHKLFSTPILYLCIATDISFIILHGVYKLNDKVSDEFLKISTDRGYAEVFQYIKEYWIICILILLAFKTRSLLYAVWSGLFIYLLLDDSLAIHETWGLAMSEFFSFPPLFGLKTNDLGEIAISLIIGCGFLILIAITYRLGDSFARRTSKFLIFMLFALGFVGIITDSLHVMVKIELLKLFLTIIEDGGEMIVMSIILAFVLLLPERLNLSTEKTDNSI